MTINPNNVILVDVDGPCADFDAQVIQMCTKYEMPLPKGIRVGVLSAIQTQFGQAQYETTKQLLGVETERNHTFKVIPGAQQAIATLRDHGYVIHWCTSPLDTSSTWCSDRVDWIAHHFGVRDSKNPWLDVTFTKEKSLVRGLTLIDDWDYHITQWNIVNAPTKYAMWFNQSRAGDRFYWEGLTQRILKQCPISF